MKRIYKYELSVTDTQTLNLPLGAELLTVQIQHGKVVLWALVDIDTDETESVELLTFGTGHDITEPNMQYIATYQVQGGILVFHVFKKL